MCASKMAQQMTLLVASPMNAVGEGMRPSCSCAKTSTHTQQPALLSVDRCFMLTCQGLVIFTHACHAAVAPLLMDRVDP